MISNQFQNDSAISNSFEKKRRNFKIICRAIFQSSTPMSNVFQLGTPFIENMATIDTITLVFAWVVLFVLGRWLLGFLFPHGGAAAGQGGVGGLQQQQQQGAAMLAARRARDVITGTGGPQRALTPLMVRRPPNERTTNLLAAVVIDGTRQPGRDHVSAHFACRNRERHAADQLCPGHDRQHPRGTAAAAACGRRDAGGDPCAPVAVVVPDPPQEGQSVQRAHCRAAKGTAIITDGF